MNAQQLAARFVEYAGYAERPWIWTAQAGEEPCDVLIDITGVDDMTQDLHADIREVTVAMVLDGLLTEDEAEEVRIYRLAANHYRIRYAHDEVQL